MNVYKSLIITKNQIIQIKTKYIPYKYSAAKIAKEYNVSRSCIEHIINGNSWN